MSEIQKKVKAEQIIQIDPAKQKHSCWGYRKKAIQFSLIHSLVSISLVFMCGLHLFSSVRFLTQERDAYFTR